ncbi:hypothetical protein [Kineosporia sp. A_224]|uniref:hypothetical protein n=1 Tax=Kineosporia sp. A_224 TaxID=1962180 RepID=UPI000B4AC7AB|nr:hypothetical protein [Kineosporia sp. A_224]
MSHNTSGPERGIVCRFRSMPRSLGFALLAVPVTAAAVGTFGVLPANAHDTRTQQVAQRSAPATATPASGPASASTAPKKPATGRADDGRSAKKDADDEAGDDRRHGRDKDDDRHHGHHQKYTAEEALGAFFDAGYLYEDAVALKRAWHSKADVSDVKVRAGRKLLAGRDLPVDPSGTPATEQEIAERAALDAYLDAGFDSDDADLLALLWGPETDAYEAKVLAGSKLLAGGEVPIEHGQTAWSVSDDAARAAYFNNGYDYADALVLADVWSGVADLADVKANAGHKILDRLPLPGGVLPFDGDQADAGQQAALDAFFAAGYDYDDAVALARIWGGIDPFDAKVMAGDKLIAGIDLPVAA